MRISSAGEALIIGNEGKKYTSYLDSKGYGSIGVGHLITPTESGLKSAHLTESQVQSLFNQDAKIREDWINSHCQNWKPAIKQNEFDALMSFLWQYNIDKYPNTKSAIIDGDRKSIVSHLMQFTSVVPANGDNKLLARRQREIKMFVG